MSGVLSGVLAFAFFALWGVDAWGQADVWLMWGWINLAIASVFVIADAMADR